MADSGRRVVTLEIEDAFRILDLKPGASLKEVVEARDDMLALWNPERFPSGSRLRSKAPDKVGEIHDAYETLMHHLGEPGPSGGPSSQPIATGSASLYDEVFSQGKRPSIPLWLIVVVTAVLVLAGLYLSQFVTSPETKAAPPIESPAEPTQPEPPPEGAAEAVSTGAAAIPEPGRPEVGTQSAAPPNPSAPSQKPAAAPADSTTPSDSPPRQGPKPLLKHREIGSTQAREAAESEPPASQAEQESQRKIAEKAFQDLLANSEQARNLAKGQLWDLHFDHWQVVQQTDAEVWIDLVALHGDGKPVHHIWAVRTADGKPRPLSEAARDLESVGAETAPSPKGKRGNRD